MTDWLQQDLTLVVGWLVTFLSSVITSVLLAPLVSHRLRRVAESRDAHLAELKDQLLTPMLSYLTDHALPILELKCGNLGVRAQSARQVTAGVFENSAAYREDFFQHESTEPPVDPLPSSYERAPIVPLLEGALFDDASAHHYQAMIAAWRELMLSLDKYNAACISYAERLRSEILAASSLPQYDPALSGPPVIHSAQLALIVFYRQLGLDTGRFSRAPAGGSLEALAYQASHWYAQGTSEAITKVSAKLDELLAQRDTIEKLIGDANSLRLGALKVKLEIERLLLVRRLPGKCRYLA